MQGRVVEGALARFVDHDFDGGRCKLVNDVVAVLAANQNATVGARIADPQ